MSRGYRTIVVILGLIVLVGQASAQFDRTSLLINIPTADVLPAGSLAGSVGLTLPLTDPATSRNSDTEMGAALRFSPFNRFELALTAYTLKDYVLGASYQVFGGPDKASLALGIHDIGLHEYVSPIGNGEDDAWEDWQYADGPVSIRPKERFSGFAVMSLPITGFARAHAGLGRGRYVGYSRGGNINTDLFVDGYNQWAIGLIGGLELNPARFLTIGLDFDGRDVNAGIKTRTGGLTVALAATKLEGFTPEQEDQRFGRLALAAEYQINLRRPPKPVVAPEPPIVVAPEPRPAPELPELRLEPIYFAFDRSEIRPGDAEILKHNAQVIKSQVDAGESPKITIEGHCCPLGTAAYNMALGMRRAESTRRYLVNLGVDNTLLSTISYGEERLVTTNPAEYPRNRRCEFRVEK